MDCHLHMFLWAGSGGRLVFSAGVIALEVGGAHRLIQEFAFAADAAVVFRVAITAVPGVFAAVPRLGEPVQILHGLAHQERDAGRAVAEGGVVVKIPGQVLTLGAGGGEPSRVQGGVINGRGAGAQPV